MNKICIPVTINVERDEHVLHSSQALCLGTEAPSTADEAAMAVRTVELGILVSRDVE